MTIATSIPYSAMLLFALHHYISIQLVHLNLIQRIIAQKHNKEIEYKTQLDLV